MPALAALALLAACTPDAPALDNRAEPPRAEAPTPTAAPANTASLHEWLVGTWSYGGSCATDMVIHFNADGSLDHAGDTGTWSVEGDRVVELLREKFDEASEAAVRLDPPERRAFTVTRGDGAHGSIAYQGHDIAILRC